MISVRFASIALRNYTARPEEREPAVRMLLRSALRMCVAHLGSQEAAKIAFETLTENDTAEHRAC